MEPDYRVIAELKVTEFNELLKFYGHPDLGELEPSVVDILTAGKTMDYDLPVTQWLYIALKQAGVNVTIH